MILKSQIRIPLVDNRVGTQKSDIVADRLKTNIKILYTVFKAEPRLLPSVCEHFQIVHSNCTVVIRHLTSPANFG